MKDSQQFVKNIKQCKNKKGAKPIKIIKNLDSDKIDKWLSLYLDCLDDKRFDDYYEWLDIGIILYNEGASCDLWDKYSQKVPEKYNKDPQNCYKKWQSFSKNRDTKLTFKTLRKMAKEDDIYKYKKAYLCDRDAIYDDIFFDGGTDENLADLFHYLKSDTYIYDHDYQDWYKLNKYSIYEQDNKDNCLLKDHIKSILYNDVDVEYKRRKNVYFSELNNIEQKLFDEEIEKDDKKELRKQQKDIRGKIKDLIKYTKFIKKRLSTNKGKRDIIEELKILYNRRDIFEKMDSVNPYIIPFRNGVYDLKKHGFRNAVPSELVTCVIGYKYNGKINKKVYNELDKAIGNIFDNKEEQDYVTKTLSTCLVGENNREEFYLWIGEGSVEVVEGGAEVVKGVKEVVTGRIVSGVHDVAEGTATVIEGGKDIVSGVEDVTQGVKDTIKGDKEEEKMEEKD